MKTWNLKQNFEKYDYESFKFEIIFSNSGVARIYLGDCKTKYYANGYGYDKTSAVIADMINDLIGVQNYDNTIYGNRNGLLSGGVGFGSIKESFVSIGCYKLNHIYSGLNSNIYEISFK